jgi:hypothetical protein
MILALARIIEQKQINSIFSSKEKPLGSLYFSFFSKKK